MSCRRFSTNHLCLIALASFPQIGPKTIRLLMNSARQASSSIIDYLKRPAKDICAQTGITRRQAEIILSVDSLPKKASETLEVLKKTNLEVVLQNDKDYPEQIASYLKNTAPPVFFYAGDVSILDRKTVAIIGSRDPTASARKAAYRFARSLAKMGATIVSGGARGIDTAGHQGGLAGGQITVIPALGIANYRWNDIDRSLLQVNKWCTLGQFPVRDPWRTRNALQRNHTIVAASDVVCGFEPRDEGGTWRSCRSAIRMNKPLFVVNASPKSDRQRGQRYFVNRGAGALSPDQMPSPAEFWELVEDQTASGPAAQAELFD